MAVAAPVWDGVVDQGAAGVDPWPVEVQDTNQAVANVIAAGAYTTSQNSGVLTNAKNTCAIVFIKITAVGTGSLRPAIQFVDTVTGDAYQVNLGEPAFTAVGNYAIVLGAAASAPNLATGSGVKQVVPLPVPRAYRIVISHVNTSSSSWTYQVNVALFGT